MIHSFPRFAASLIAAGVCLSMVGSDSSPASAQEVPPEVTPATAEHEPLPIADVRHINHTLVLIDEYERRFRIPDGTYVNDTDRRIVIRQGKIVELKGCADAECTVTAHATRIMSSRLSVYAELVVPDGTFRCEVGEGDEKREVSFTIEGGRLTEFLDPAQRAFAPKAGFQSTTDSEGAAPQAGAADSSRADGALANLP